VGTWPAITAGPINTDPTDRLSAVNNLQFGANVFRWSVASAQGVCAPTTADLTITRTNAPTANNLSPNDLCEEVANTGIAQNVDLAANYDNLITGGNPTVVSWFTDPARTIPVANVNSEDVADGSIYYVRVSTTGMPVCSSNGIVNFSVSPKPFVANINPVLCEDGFGTGVVNDVNLVADFNGDVSLNVGNRAVTWFLEAGLINPVPTPTDVDNISDGTQFFARVENTTTGCFDVATVQFIINDMPADNPISGPNTVCDGLSLAAEEKPDLIVDIATLTGTCKAALGEKIAGLFGGDDASAIVSAAAEAAGERTWRLPLHDDYRKLIDSEVADMKNTGGKFGGAITAALLLKEFVGDVPWVHLDIAGPARASEAEHYIPKGATGFGVRTMVEIVRRMAGGGPGEK
jgi:hypothetical protein